jgi:glutathione synthase/RimK-type ligase-like ATP-grasp enzyme
MNYRADLAILFEHPEWQKPLFQALERRGIRYAPVDLKKAAFSDTDAPLAPLYFNQASPSAYVRGNTRAVPYVLAYMRALQICGVRVLNGADAFALEISKTAQAALLRSLGVPAPRVWTFNDLDAIRARAQELSFPVLLKPEQGGSGARIVLVESFAHLESLLTQRPEYWLPDNLLLLQEYIPTDPAKGIVRMDFLGGELLYAMRVISHGRFNLCPAPVCNPEDGAAGVCEVPAEQTAAPPVEFYPYPEVPAQAVALGKRIIAAGKLDVGGVEYLETEDGRLMFYDINANSNLRPSIGQAFGFDPFERVVDFLVREMKRSAGVVPRKALA